MKNTSNWYRIGNDEQKDIEVREDEIKTLKKTIEPWLTAVFQSEHLALLLGSGFTTAIACQAGTTSTTMEIELDSKIPHFSTIEKAIKTSAKKLGRDRYNIEDVIRIINIASQGLKIIDDEDINHLALKEFLNSTYERFCRSVYLTERHIKDAIEQQKGEKKLDPLIMLVSFLLSFSSRTASRERLHIFTTNYDRLIEYGADLAGLHLLDRFVGSLEPIFRSSRLDIDIHYNPPGIRGEPRYLEGVVRLTKLHGSLDWFDKNGLIRKTGIPFGADEELLKFHGDLSDSLMIYPNSAKDRETAEYPYVELFRDYAAAICRPNSVLVTYGYGFGDEHINRAIADMLTIPSTHLVIISYDNASGRITKFLEKIGRKAQISLLIGPHFGDMQTLVENYLPKPAIDRISIRQTDLLRNRNWLNETNDKIENKSAIEGVKK